ncbi:glycosyltransferase [Runella aurantiaca]|uniref:Glycosyltransferase n=1 Tax=Runella aurantiaca TaxID=2282308 RepID=A0A369IG86_9BACT|nr:glycosyltransferase [Runella aurantiaca]RDB06284.1 glycosyltransferase [Runella aurantiaca]
MDQKIKILHVVEAFGSGIVDFLSILTSLEEFEYTILYSERELKISEIKPKFKDNIKFIEWEFAKRKISIYKDLKSYLYFSRFLRNNSFDIIHLHSSKAGIIGRVWGLFNKSVPIFYSPHGAPFARKDISFLRRLFFESIEYIASKLSGEVICVSHSESELYNKIGIKADFINNGIYIREPKLYPKNENQINIITVGRISNQKNPTMFNQIALFFNNNPRIKFIWVGDGESINKLYSENIRITGWLSKSDLSNELKNAHIYISTSLWEGLPLAVLEAMEHQLPLVLNKCVGNIDLLQEGKNGFFFEEQSEAIHNLFLLIDNQILRENFGEESFKLLKNKFNSDNMIKSYRLLYLQYKDSSSAT